MSPPLDLAIAPGTFIAVCTRLVRAKRIELAIEAAASLHLPLVIVGEGRDRQRLESLATSGTIFAGYRPPGELRWILRNARLFVSAAEEDFGIAVAEALCEGTPCVVPDASGVVSLLAAGMGWTYDAAFGAPALIASIESALGEPSRLSPQQVRRTRKRLARETFRRRIAAAIA
jgi:glycosyltransferase involved in cell wall biosynthesis